MIRKCEICGKEFETKGGRYPRLYCDEHLYEERECVVCKKKFTVLRYKDQLTCSCECSNVYYPRHEKKDPVVKICPFCGKEYSSKSNTCSKSCATKLQLQRQGSPFGRKDVQEKSKQTMIERYETPYAQMNEEIKDKTRESEGAKRTKFKEGQDYRKFWIDKLGVDNPQRNEKIKIKTMKTKEKRYNDGQILFNQVSKLNLRIRDFILKETGILFSVEKVIEKYSYDLCYENLLIEINPTVSHNSTCGFEYITGRSEINSPVPEDQHFKRWKVAKDNGYDLIIIWDWTDLHKVIDLINSKLGLIHNKIYARNCEIRSVSKLDADNFYNINHIQGKHNGIHTGLYYKDNLVSVMSWSGNELVRFANLNNTVVIGAYSKLFSHSKPTRFNELISFSFNDYSNGNVYKNNGWELVGNVKPRYWWVSGNTVLNRRDCQKRNISKMYPDYYNYEDKSDIRTEKELMIGLGFVQVFDCGKQKWKYIINN